ncbi:MAG TPA: VOC family protein [Candidatus Acidoferrales bacterium]|nr:VOC family protein [Candidatus Acidoferrales bacterium]
MALVRLTHIGICVSDWQRSLHFYRDLLGFRYLSELQIGGEPTNTLLQLNDVDLRALYLERDGTRIELLHYASPGHCGDATPRAMNRLGLTHLSMRVDNLAQTLTTLEQAGVQVLTASRIDIPAFEAGAVFVTDPDGTLIELVQAPGDPAQPPGA